MDEAESSEDLSSVSAVSDADKELARKSREDFHAGLYVECIQSLLRFKRPNDPKVLHNKAVVEYYLSDFKRTDEFKKHLRNVCDQVHVSLNDVDSLDDVEQCVLYFNHAVILYHLRQYNAALVVLDKIFQFIEPLEPRLARHVCFLLLEVYLCTYQPEKALGMINYIESMLFESRNTEGKAEADPKVAAAAVDQLDPKESEEYKMSLQQYKARCYLMLRSLKGCKRELKSLLTSNGASQTTVFLKANLEYARGNYRKVIKILNSIPAQSKSFPEVFKETGENIPVLYYNNMGCTHFYMGRPNLGCLYFTKALHENENSIKQLSSKPELGVNGRPIFTFGSNYRYEICYNMGIELLHVKKTQQGFDFLIEAVQAYHTNPRLWLRIAECCIQLHQPDNETDFRLRESKKSMLQAVIGTGVHRKILLTPYVNKLHDISQASSASVIPSLTLEFAATCLRNALVLLPDETSLSSGTGSLSTGADETEGAIPDNILVPAPPGNPIRGSEIGNLRCSILAASAYVALSIGDVVMALHYAQSLLAQPKLSTVHKYLGHLYAGEALVYADQISAAINEFNQSNMKDLSLNFCSAEKDEKISSEDHTNANNSIKGWFPNSVSAAKMVMQYNLTVAYTIRGELDKASDILKQLNTKGCRTDIPVQALMLAMYIQMQLGHADIAKTIIRQHFPQFR